METISQSWQGRCIISLSISTTDPLISKFTSEVNLVFVPGH